MLDNLAAKARITYHQTNYFAQANWNLVDEFQHPVSFEHKAKGYAVAADAEIEYEITKRLSGTLSAKHGYGITGRGTDTLYRKNGDVTVTPLNQVQRNYVVLSAGVQLAF